MTSKTMNDFVSNEDSLGSIKSMGILIENEDSDYYDFIEYEDKIKYVIEKKCREDQHLLSNQICINASSMKQ